MELLYENGGKVKVCAGSVEAKNCLELVSKFKSLKHEDQNKTKTKTLEFLDFF